MDRAHPRRTSDTRTRLVAAALTGGLVAALASTPTLAAPAAVGPAARAASDESRDFNFPGADTLPLHDGSGKYVTYGASAHGYKVPYTISGSGDVVRTSPRIDGGVLTSGAGAWAAKGSGIWTPGAFYRRTHGVGRYYLFYTAVVRGGDGKHCVGVAYSTKPTSGFVTQDAPLACPTKKTRWAIDADVTTGPGGGAWMVWRDGQRAPSGTTSALSTMRLRFAANGTVSRGSEPKVLLTNAGTVRWSHYHDGTGVSVLENPSAVYLKGSWYLFYSGNSWPTNYYSTGIAYCGAKLDDGRCGQLPGPGRAYFAYSGPKAHLPKDQRYRGLPGNKRGPGAMDVYLARDGRPWVTWNYLTGNTGTGRKSRVGRLVMTGSGASASFSVRLP